MREAALIYWRFARLGCRAFGGPFPQIAMLQRELVEQEKWTTHGRFNRVLAVYQALPGPEATEMCVWLGSCRAGRLGGLAAGLGFITPGTLLVLLSAWLYTQMGITPLVSAALSGAQVGALALLFNAARTVGVRVCSDSTLVFVAVAAGVSTLAGMHFAAVLLMGVGAGYFTGRGKNWLGFGLIGGCVLFSVMIALWLGLSSAGDEVRAAGTGINAGKAQVWEGAASGLKAGALSFGGAYTAVPYLRDDAVRGFDWLTHAQFAEGLAIVNALPAPLVSLAGFVGLIAGGAGSTQGWLVAVVMLMMVYLPAFAFTLIGHARIERLVEEESVQGALDGAAAAVVGMVGAAGILMVKPVLLEPGGTWPVKVGLCVVAFAAAWRLKGWWVGPAVVMGCAAAGAVILK